MEFEPGMDSKDFHQKNFDRISKEASEMAQIVLLPNGVQAKVYGTKYVLTFYYRTKKYHLNISGSMVLFTPGREKKVIEKYYLRQVHSNEYLAALPQNVALPIHKKPENKVIELTDKGTQACIDHIKRKLETFKKVNQGKEGNQTATMLLNLTLELEQYL